jgi:hypothetical protein
VAAPVFAQIAAGTLRTLQVPPDAPAALPRNGGTLVQAAAPVAREGL